MKAPPPAHPRRKRARVKTPRTPSPAGFQAFIAYGDIPAARRAMDEIRTVLIAHDRDYRLEPRLWRFDQLTRPRWRDVALRDAGTANIVVIASSEPSMVGADTEGWIAMLLAQKQVRATRIVIVLGTSEAWTISVEKIQPAEARGTTARARTRPAAPAGSRAPSAARAA